ncbi:sugar nucleotide-binding protein [Streptomyces sp. NPDC007872]|uniref:sugar nucleotide-binding protein n=1 Tax=Streptomyces sp. NPDC007872 TaxID=3364782 RepID=UPI00368B4174
MGSGNEPTRHPGPRVALPPDLEARVARGFELGGSGFLGTELVRQAVAAGRPPAVTFHSRLGNVDEATWRHLDFRNPSRLGEVLDTVTPTVVIKTTSGGADWAITAEGGVRLALAAADRSIRLVLVSSDAIFSGQGRDPT